MLLPCTELCGTDCTLRKETIKGIRLRTELRSGTWAAETRSHSDVVYSLHELAASTTPARMTRQPSLDTRLIDTPSDPPLRMMSRWFWPFKQFTLHRDVPVDSERAGTDRSKVHTTYDRFNRGFNDLYQQSGGRLIDREVFSRFYAPTCHPVGR